MSKTTVLPAGTGKPLAPYVPGSMADGILYVSGTLPFDKDNNVVHVGDAAAQTRHVLETIKGVVEEAGGRFTSLEGEPGPFGGSALASNGLLHDEVLELLTPAS